MSPGPYLEGRVSEAVEPLCGAPRAVGEGG
jgi:hypothetical protein